MDFNFTPEEQELQRRVRNLAEEQIAPIADKVDESCSMTLELMSILPLGLLGRS